MLELQKLYYELGYEAGEQRTIKLVRAMCKDKRIDDLQKAMEDPEYLQKCYDEYGIKSDLIKSEEYFPKVVQVIPTDSFHVQVTFSDGKIVDYDASDDLKSEIFEPLRDIEKFKNACTIMHGTLAWDISGKGDVFKCIDIDPFSLYKNQR